MPRWPDGEAGGEQPDHKTHRPHTRDTVTRHTTVSVTDRRAPAPPTRDSPQPTRDATADTAQPRSHERHPAAPTRYGGSIQYTQYTPHHPLWHCGGHGAVERARLQRRVWAHLAPACRKAPARFRFYPPRPSRDCPMCNLLKASRGFQFLPAMESAARDECLAEAHKPRTHQEHGSSRLLNAGRRGK